MSSFYNEDVAIVVSQLESALFTNCAHENKEFKFG